MTNNHVQVNVGAHGSDKGPVHERPILTINGVEIEAVQKISITAEAGELTEVTVSFYAAVSGDLVTRKVT